MTEQFLTKLDLEITVIRYWSSYKSEVAAAVLE